MSQTNLKSEPMDISVVDDPIDLESEILQLCRQHPRGVNHKLVRSSFPSMPEKQCLEVINRLIASKKIDLLSSTTESGTFFYRLRESSTTSQSSITIGNSSMDQMETSVYQIIRESGNLGIWIRDIKFKTRLPPTILTKTLKVMETKKLIKSVTSVHANKRKVYMLYELIPDSSITGGPFHTGNEFEAEFVSILAQQCARLLDERLEKSMEKYPQDLFLQRTNACLSSIELAAGINEMGISKISLTVRDIESILNTLIFDGKIEKMVVASTIMKENDAKSNLYRSVKSIIATAPIVRNPCGICPVFNDCHEEGLITPSTCIYLNNWLNF